MFAKIDHNSPLPLHAQVEKLLRDLIKLSEYKEGKLLPNEVDLAKRLGISRNTVRQATNKLVLEGLITRKKGIGTKAAEKKTVNTKLESWLSFTQEMNENGIMFKNYEISVDWVEPAEEIAKFFGIRANKLVLKMDRLRGGEDGPFVYFSSYFHPRVGLKGDEDFSKPLYHMLEEQYHTVVSISREEIRAMTADKLLSKKLNMKVGEPILFRKRFVSDINNRPVEFNTGYYKADRFAYSIKILRGESKK
ncbi:MAG: GntR family transcriptional regulator [Ignavibacteriaceae bacterium]|nr:GntR family transcriptional regulator [Ignavibacteriaceae bacterium]